MKQITLNALIRRARRRALRKGFELHIHRANERDFVMGGRLFSFWTRDGKVEAYTDLDGFIEICRSEGTLKNYEEVAL